MARSTGTRITRVAVAVATALGLTLATAVTAQAAPTPTPQVGTVERAAPGSSWAKDELFFYDAGRYQYANMSATGRVSSMVATGAYGSGIQSVAPLDVDGDGRDELLMHRTNGEVVVYELGRPGRITSKLSTSTLPTQFERLVGFDIDGNGRDELFAYDAQTGAFRMFHTNTRGEITSLIRMGTWKKGATAVTAVDLDGDGRDELMTYRSSDGAATFIDIGAGGSYKVIRQSSYKPGYSVITGLDVDRDAADELLFYKRAGGSVTVWNVTTTGGLSKVLSTSTWTGRWPVVVAANVDAPPPKTSTTASEMLRRVNAERAEAGLKPLQLMTAMTTEAQRWSRVQAADGRISHRSDLSAGLPSGWRYIGENVASGYGSVPSVMEGWMNSPGHRANILNPRFTHLGVGLAYDGRGTPYWTQIFAQY